MKKDRRRTMLARGSSLTVLAMSAGVAFNPCQSHAQQLPDQPAQATMPASPAAGTTDDQADPSALPAQSPAASGEPARPSAEDIVVTGSRAVRDGFRAPTPVTVLGVEDINRQAPRDITDFVTQVPSIVGSMTPATRAVQGSNGTNGIATPSLRGLGTNRTLILIDGQRSVASTQTGEVDVGTIPQQLIRRVDVVTGGASAAYGSDALAGVINFVLDREFTGLKGEASGGFTEYGDDANYRLALTGGLKFADGRGHLLASVEATDTGGAYGNSTGNPPKRAWQYGSAGIITNPAYTATNGRPQYIVVNNYASSTSTKGGIITSGPLRGTAFDYAGAAYQFDYGLRSLDGSYQSGGSWQNSDITGFQDLTPKQSRQNYFARASFEFSPAINLFAQASLGESSTTGHQSTRVDQGSLTIRADNAFLPADVAARARALGVTSFSIGRVQTGERQGAHVERRVERYVVGGNGTFDVFGSGVQWNAYYQHGKMRSDDEVVGNRRQTEYLAALDSVVSPTTGAIVCRSTLTNPTNGCVPLNPFGFAPPTPGAKSYVYGSSMRQQFFIQNVVAADLRSEPFSTWAGPVSLAIGAEHRTERARGTVDALSAARRWFSGNYAPLNGGYKVTEGFAEVQVPLAKDVPFARTLDVNGAVRATDYSVSGYVTTWKVGGTWAPIDDIRFRVTRSRDIRAPNLSELFTPALNATVGILDPGNNSFVQVVQVTTGNLALVPERADTLGFGVVLQPSFLPGFNASVDYYKIKVDDAIGTVAAQDIVNQCAAGQTVFCDAISRSTTNGVSAITQINNQPFNFARQEAEGIDFEVGYRTPVRLLAREEGNLTFRGFVTHFLRNVRDNGITPAVDLVGETRARDDTPSLGSIPKWKFVANITYDQEPFSLNVTFRGVGSGIINSTYIECSTNCPVSTVNYPTIDNNRVRGQAYADATLTLRPDLPARPEVFLSVKNLTNASPVIVPRGPGGLSYGARGTQESLYDILGRVYRVGARFRF